MISRQTEDGAASAQKAAKSGYALILQPRINSCTLQVLRLMNPNVRIAVRTCRLTKINDQNGRMFSNRGQDLNLKSDQLKLSFLAATPQTPHLASNMVR